MENETSYYNVEGITTVMQEAKLKVKKAIQLVDKEDLDSILDGFVLLAEGSQELADLIKFFKRRMSSDNYHKILAAVEEDTDEVKDL